MSNGENDQVNTNTYCWSDDTFGSASPLGIPCFSYENIMSHGHGGVHNGGTTSKFATNLPDDANQEEDETTRKQDDDGKCRPLKRHRSAQVHNLTERLRRQRLKEKMRLLQQLIPNCNKRDKASTLDEAINYIKHLQYQLQMMSSGPGFTMFRSPCMAMSFPQGTQIPNLPPYHQTRPSPYSCMGYANGESGIDHSGVNFPTVGLHSSQHCPALSNSQLGYGIGIGSGFESRLASANIPFNQIGSHSKCCSLPIGSQLVQGGVTEVLTFHNAGDVSEPLTCNPLDHVIGQYERLVHNGTPRTSGSTWDMVHLPHMPSFSEASESFS